MIMLRNPRAASCLVIIAILVAASAIAIAPEDYAMGNTQRILYVHVSVAWLALLAFLGMAATGAVVLVTRQTRHDLWAQAANELGWGCCTLTLLTGSLWARAAWGTWWTWDPRLTTTFVLWLIYSGSLLVRWQSSDVSRRASSCGVLAILGALDVPLIVMATRWFRGIHPVSPEMEPAMRVVLACCLACFTIAFLVLLLMRHQHLTRFGLSVRKQTATVRLMNRTGART